MFPLIWVPSTLVLQLLFFKYTMYLEFVCFIIWLPQTEPSFWGVTDSEKPDFEVYKSGSSWAVNWKSSYKKWVANKKTVIYSIVFEALVLCENDSHFDVSDNFEWMVFRAQKFVWGGKKRKEKRMHIAWIWERIFFTFLHSIIWIV